MSDRAKILLIEDNEILRQLVGQILEIENYRTLVAVDGEAGLRLARELVPDLILCDIAMPKMTGYEVLRALREDPATKSIPFIFLTAKAERSDVRSGLELGADNYLSKPFDANELLAAVRKCLRKHESARKAARQATEQRQHDLLLNLPHEVRTLLSGITGLADLLGEGEFSIEERRSVAREIAATSRQLERTLTNRILHLELELARTSPERAGSFFAVSPIAVHAVLSAAVTAKSKEYARRIELKASAVPAVSMAAACLQKAVEELLDNALRFSPAGAPVQLSVSEKPPHVVIEITDLGPAMTAQQILRMQAFRHFDRAHLQKEGLGHGLAIARHLVEIAHGSLLLTPQPTGGLTATLRLPAAQ